MVFIIIIQRVSDSLTMVREHAAKLATAAAEVEPESLLLFAADLKNDQRVLALKATVDAPDDLRRRFNIHNTQGAAGKLHTLWGGDYLRAMRAAAFVASPSGNNNECFRTWEVSVCALMCCAVITSTT